MAARVMVRVARKTGMEGGHCTWDVGDRTCAPTVMAVQVT